jgi:hypothetical protein
LRWIDSIKEATGLSLEVLKESVKDRKKMAQDGGRKNQKQGTNKCEKNAGEGNGKPLLNITIAYEIL